MKQRKNEAYKRWYSGRKLLYRHRMKDLVGMQAEGI